MARKREVIGPLEWLTVSALAQSPTQRLPIAVLYQHMAPWQYPHQVQETLLSFAKMDFINFHEGGLVIGLSEAGAKLRRKSRKTDVPAYWPLVLPPGVILE
jgi:hypothetical protein